MDTLFPPTSSSSSNQRQFLRRGRGVQPRSSISFKSQNSGRSKRVSTATAIHSRVFVSVHVPSCGCKGTKQQDVTAEVDDEEEEKEEEEK